MKKILEFDTYDNEESVAFDLRQWCSRMIGEYPVIAKYGSFGMWNGPVYGGTLITTEKDLFGHICQDFSVNMNVALLFTEEKDTVESIQRYCPSYHMEIPPKSVILIQCHHDGTNQYILRPVRKGRKYDESKGSFIEWCKKNTMTIRREVALW